MTHPYQYITDPKLLPAIADEIRAATVIGIDTETTGLDPYKSAVRLVSINTGSNIYVIDLWKTLTFEPVRTALAESKCIKVGQNLKFDQKFFLHHFQLELWPLFDTYRASALIHNGKKGFSHDLYSIYTRELGINAQAPDLGGSNWSSPELTQDQIHYAAEDVFHLHDLREKLKPQLSKLGLNKIALIEFRVIIAEASMELNGLLIDKERWLQVYKENFEGAVKMRHQLLRTLPNPSKQIGLFGEDSDDYNADFNIDSSSQLLQSLLLAGATLEGKPLPSTGKNVLAMAAGETPIVQEVLKYRKFATVVKMFGPKYLSKFINPVTGRVHTHYYPFTDAGRYSCVTGDTLVLTDRGEIPILDVNIGDRVWTHKRRWREVTEFLHQGVEETLTLALESGRTLRATRAHRVLTSKEEWTTFADLKVHDEIQADTGLDRILTIEAAPETEVYDISVLEDESYLSNGIFSHNCQKPNLQQIPRDKRYRHCFRAAEGWVLIVADYSQIELRIIAELSKDPILIAAYKNGEDLHTKTASITNSISMDKVTKEMRNAAKAINFGFCYGMGAKKFVIYAQATYGVAMTVKDAEKFQKRYFDGYPGIKAWHKRTLPKRKFGEEGEPGETRTILGRLRYVGPQAYSEHLNGPSQGSGADGLKIALYEIYNRLRKYNGKAKLCHCVHDEIILEVKNEPEVVESARKDLEDAMVLAMKDIITSIPVEADAAVGNSWYEAK